MRVPHVVHRPILPAADTSTLISLLQVLHRNLITVMTFSVLQGFRSELDRL